MVIRNTLLSVLGMFSVFLIVQVRLLSGAEFVHTLTKEYCHLKNQDFAKLPFRYQCAMPFFLGAPAVKDVLIRGLFPTLGAVRREYDAHLMGCPAWVKKLTKGTALDWSKYESRKQSLEPFFRKENLEPYEQLLAMAVAGRFDDKPSESGWKNIFAFNLNFATKPEAIKYWMMEKCN